MTKTTIDDGSDGAGSEQGGGGRALPGAHIRGTVLALAERQRRAGVGLGSFAAEVGVSTTEANS